MREGTNQRQIAGNISFGHQSIYTADIGKNGGHRWINHIGSVSGYTDYYEFRDQRDGEVVKFNSTKELYTYVEYKYRAEIEFFKYNVNLKLDNKQTA